MTSGLAQRRQGPPTVWVMPAGLATLVFGASPHGFAPGDSSCCSLAMVLGGGHSLPPSLGGEQTLQFFPGASNFARAIARSSLASCGSLALAALCQVAFLWPLFGGGSLTVSASLWFRIYTYILQASYVHRLNVEILVAHWVNYDYTGGKGRLPSHTPRKLPSPT